MLGLGSGAMHTLPPSLTVPPTLHPNVYPEILIVVTPSGLVLKSKSTSASVNVRVGWGVKPKVEVVDSALSVDWTKACVVYGIVGILKLSQCMIYAHLSDYHSIENLIQPNNEP